MGAEITSSTGNQPPEPSTLQGGEAAQFHLKVVEVNEALLLNSLHQHELTASAERLNAQLRVEISERKSAERALRENEWRLRYAAASARLTYVEVDLIQLTARTAENFSTVMGYTPPSKQEVDISEGTRKLLLHVVPEDRSRVETSLKKFIEGKPIGKIDYRVLGDDQIERWIESRWSIERDTNGRPVKSFATNLDITERKHAEQALHESEKRYHHLFTSIDEGFCVVEMIFDEDEKPVDYIFLEVNPSFEKQSGLIGVTGKRILDIIPTFEKVWIDKFAQVLSTGESIRFVNEVKALKGWFDVYAMPIGLPENRKVALLFNNVTDQRQIAVDLAEKARLLNLSNDAIIVCGFDNKITSWNQGAERLYGWTFEEILGKDLHSLMQTEFPKPKEEIIAELHRVGHFSGEVVQIARDGRRVASLCRWVLDADTQSILTSYTDITDRKRAEEALCRSEEFNRSIVESNRDCLKVLDLEGNLLMMAPIGQKMLCIEDIRLYLGKPWIEFYQNEEREAARAAVQAAVAGGGGHFTGFFRTLNGQAKWWDVVVSPIRDAMGNPERILAVSRDITERRALEDSLVARATELSRADRNKDEFLAMLAHELRNPLAPLRNAAEILKTSDVSLEEREEAEGILMRQIENMSHMIDDLLDISRITEGKIELRRSTVSLEDILQSAVNQTLPNIKVRDQKLTLNLPSLPVFLDADATRLEQVFGNLLGNACKYSDPGCHISLTAECASFEENKPTEVVIRVKDNGNGIASELLPHIFGLFVQSNRALDRAYGGLGIGLALVQRLVKMHLGTVEAFSEGLGKGSEFIVRLPMVSAPTEPRKKAVASTKRETSRRILIVDDNEDSARSMASIQKRRGHETRVAFSGTEAVAIAMKFLPEVVLLDIGLPGMDGYQVARVLRSIPELENVLLVGISGYGNTDDIAMAKKAGFDEYLVKPADLDLLREWLKSRL